MSRISIKTENRKFETAPDLYGVFFEDISHAGDGGLYPEMLRNRSFEDSLLPEGCTLNADGITFTSPTGWVDEFNNGEGMSEWVERLKLKPTPIPAWYFNNASARLCKTDTLNEKRKTALEVSFDKGGQVKNIGYGGVPQEKGREYHFYMFAKAEEKITLNFMVEADSQQTVCSAGSLTIASAEWKRYDLSFEGTFTSGTAAFVIECPDDGKVTFGFMSLMPADTFMNHGLRKDLVDKLREMKPAFLRFPGGCIVEGFTKETAMYFRNTVGPVWERPSHWLLWHYRTTNGLGFHEYLQLCEDLNLSALYVCNCGMTCQGRGPYYFTEEEFEDMLQDTLNAIEYACGPASSEWGGLRAKMGHEAPFALKYLEIGNENSGNEYEGRYERIRTAVLSKYPEMIIVSNDRSNRLKCDIVDDHYYNMPEFYAESVGLYDNYDRMAPDVFVGEFANNQTYEGQLRGAVSEAMFMIGFERNQDKVKLCSYAPLFEHVHFYSWYPNLIIYDNYRSYGIPSYYVFKLFGGNRGKYLLESTEQTEKIYRDIHGLPMITGDFGIKFRNAFYNGKKLRGYKNIFGRIAELSGNENEKCCVLTEDPENPMTKEKPPFRIYGAVTMAPVPDGIAHDPSKLSTVSDSEKWVCDELGSRTGVFDIELFLEEGKEAGVGMLCAPKPFSFYDRNNPNPRDPWMLFNLEPLRWMFADGKATLVRGGFRPEPVAPSQKVNIKYNEFNTVHYELRETEVDLFLNGELIQTVELPNYPSMCSVSTETEGEDGEVIIKIVNFAEKPDKVNLLLDCEVEDEYSVSCLTGRNEAENTLENPENVRDVSEFRTGASRDFVHEVPAMSVNVLRLKKSVK